MKKILVAIPVTEEQKIFLEKQVGDVDCKFIYKKNSELRASDVQDANYIIGSIPPEILTSAKNLEWLQANWVGVDAYLAENILPPEVILTNAKGALDGAVSEHMVALTFALARKLNLYVRQNFWRRGKGEIPIEGSTIFVLGAGNIGKKYAQKMQALGAKMIAFTRTPKAKIDFFAEQYTIDRLDENLPRADFVAMILPGGSGSKNLMNYDRLCKLKDSAFLINCGRGNSIDHDALKKLLRTGKIGGVALDVTEVEPLPEDDELWSFDNVIITPHTAWQLPHDIVWGRIFEICAENLYNKCHNKNLKNIVNRQFGY